MGTILCVGTSGPRDATRAVLPFAAALSALDMGHEPQLALMGDATYLMVDSIAARVCGVAWPPLPKLLEGVVSREVPLYV